MTLAVTVKKTIEVKLNIKLLIDNKHKADETFTYCLQWTGLKTNI